MTFASSLNLDPGETRAGEKSAQARGYIEKADAFLKEEKGSREEAFQWYDQAIAILREEEETFERTHLLASAWLNKGNLCSLSESKEAMDQAADCYQKSAHYFGKIEEVSMGEEGETREEAYVDFGALRSNQGGLALRRGGAGALEEAIRHTQQAIAIFEALPWRENLRYRHHLTGCWYNLANLLWTESRDGETVLAAYEQAAQYAGELEGEESYNLLGAVIWLNYANALSHYTQGKALARVLDFLESSIRLYSKCQILPGSRHAHELAIALANQGNFLSLPHESVESDPQKALNSIEQALTLLGGKEKEEAMVAEISLNARRARCQAYGLLLHQIDQTGEKAYFTAIDEVEEALEIIYHWETQGVQRFRAQGLRFFYLGAQMYRLRQIQFLPEFIEEVTEKLYDPEIVKQALRFLEESKVFIKEHQPIHGGMQEAEKWLQLYQEMERVERNLNASQKTVNKD